jgi:hypothetical protein
VRLKLPLIARRAAHNCTPLQMAARPSSINLGMSGNHRERVMSRPEQPPRGLALGDGLARESPVSPIPIPFALGRVASGRAAVHPATALSSDLGRAAWRAGSASGAAFAAHGLSLIFRYPPDDSRRRRWLARLS